MFSAHCISIITPVYNTPTHFVDELRQAIECQTFRDYEWILINDGSTDDSILRYLERVDAENEHVKVVHHPINKGLSAARNSGIKHSNSPYVFFVDADDLIAPTFLEKAFLVLHLNKDFAFVNSYVEGFGALEYKWTGGFHEHELFLKENRNTSCFLARREAFSMVEFNECMQKGGEDWDFWLNAASKGLWGYTIPEYLFYYRRSENNRWPSLQEKKLFADLQRQMMVKYGPALTNYFPRPGLEESFFDLGVPEIHPQAVGHEMPQQHLVCIFPWLEVGGADQFNINLLKGLKSRGWGISIITTEGITHAWEDKFKAITEDIFHLATLTHYSLFASVLSFLLESRRPQVAFLSHSMYGYYLLPYIRQRLPYLPIVDFVHCEDLNWYNGGYPYFSALYTRYLSKTLTTSEQLRNWCITAGSIAETVETCYINVDSRQIKRRDDVRQRLRAELDLTKQTPLLLYVARLTEQKQPKMLVQVLAALKARGCQFKCIVIGDGPDRNLLLKQIREKNLSAYVHFLGAQSNEVVMEYMDAADVFFLPSQYEGIALSIYEAMAKSLAIVGANVGGQAELVTEECGYLVGPGDEHEQLRNYVNILVHLINAPEKVRWLGEKGRKRIVEYFDAVKMVDQVHRCFLSLKQASMPSSDTLRASYLLILNRMLSLEKENAVLSKQMNSRAAKVMEILEKPYRQWKSHFQNLKKKVKTRL